MIGAIIGDIVGSRFEFAKQTTPNFTLFDKDCNYTDETICNVAIADAILNKKTYKDSLLYWCRKYPEPFKGYSSPFSKWIEQDHQECNNSSANDAAMRVSPIGWLFDDYYEIQDEARNCAEVSNNHPEGIVGAQCVATIIYWLRTCRITKEEIEGAVKRNFGYSIPPIKDIYKIGSEGHFDGLCKETVPYAISCFLESDNFEDAIRIAVAAGGETDTKTAICGAIAEAYYEIPDSMIEKAYEYLPDDMLDVVTQFYERIQNELDN